MMSMTHGFKNRTEPTSSIGNLIPVRFNKTSKNGESEASPVLPPVRFLKPWYDYTNMTYMTILVIPGLSYSCD